MSDSDQTDCSNDDTIPFAAIIPAKFGWEMPGSDCWNDDTIPFAAIIPAKFDREIPGSSLYSAAPGPVLSLLLHHWHKSSSRVS